MKFNPRISGTCTDHGTHCEGCGRSNEDFADFIGKSILKKRQNPS